MRGARWALPWMGLALALSLLPLGLSACCAPTGRTGLGTVWFINDFAQYESAMRQGAQRGDWLVQDPFTAEPHAPAFMFPLYVGLGKLAALTGLPTGPLLRLLEIVARALFLGALWRFVTRFAPGRTTARAAFLLALFGGGMGFLVALAGAAIGQPAGYTGNWSYETNSFGLLFGAPHVPLAMAATLELAAWLHPAARARKPRLVWALLLGAAIALLQPFHVPVLLSALLVVGAVRWRQGAGLDTLAATGAALLGALPVLAPTAATFTLDPFWGATYTLQNRLPSPAPHELVVDLGPTLLLAIAGAWLLGRGVAPFGLLVWLLLALTAMYLPLPYQRRFAFGAQPALAVVAAAGLVELTTRVRARRAAALRIATAGLAASSTVLVVTSVVLSALTNAPLPVYRSTTDLDAAAAWLGTRVQDGQAVLSAWDVGNYLAARMDGRSFGGHPVATLDPDQKRLLLATFFAHEGNMELARRMGAQWVVYGPSEAGLPMPAAAPAFQSGPVRVFRVSVP